MRDVITVDWWGRENGYKILVDFEQRSYIQDDFGRDNEWEKIFKQECVRDVCKDKKNTIILGPVNSRGFTSNRFNYTINGNKHDTSFHFLGKEGKVNRDILRSIADRYFCFRDECHNSMQEYFFHLQQKGMIPQNTMAVLMREEFSNRFRETIRDADYVETMSAHPTVPNIDETMGIVKDLKMKWGAKQVFVGTLYNETIREFCRVFGKENTFYVDRCRLDSYSDNSVSDLYSDNLSFADMQDHGEMMDDNRRWERTLTYLTELYICSKCNWFVAPRSSGGFVVPLLKKEEFADLYYFENTIKCEMK